MSTDDLEKTLKLFNCKKFRPLQEETITSIMEGNNTFAVLPTGAGKSLTYQIPAMLLKPKLTIVVSPLISLMDDQVFKISKTLNAARLHSGLKKEERNQVYENIKNGVLDILYTSPEKLPSKTLLESLNHREVGLMVVDEVHCLSVWGHDFRPSYLFLSETRKVLNNPQIALFTATAPPNVIEDVLKLINLKKYKLIQGDVIRKNIKFSVSYEKNKDERLSNLLVEKRKKKGSIIVYCTRIIEVEALYEKFSKKYPVAIYHGQMESEQKVANYNKFMSNKARIIFCTSAFGMGIDKPDIYTIIHYSLPGSVEQYIQEAGRAGRDGKRSEAILIFNYGDVKVRNGFILRTNPPVEAIEKVYNAVYQKSERLRFQCGPATLTQIQYWFSKFYCPEHSWFSVRAQSALTILLDLGFISVEDDIIQFPFGKQIKIPAHLLEEKVNNDFRRFEIMHLYAKTEGNNSEIIKNYFLGANEEIIKVKERLIETIDKKILEFVAHFRVNKGKIGEIISGQLDDLKGEEYKSFYRSLPFLSKEDISSRLEDLFFCGLVEEFRIKKSYQYALTKDGIDYLKDKGIKIPPRPSIEGNILDIRNKKLLETGIKKWAKDDVIEINRDLLDWVESFYSFVKYIFKIKSISYSGDQLLKLFSDKKGLDYIDFFKFMKYIGIEAEAPPVVPQKKKRYKRRGQYR